MLGRDVAAPDAPTPHPARDAALVRDWRQRYTIPRRLFILLGLGCTAFLVVDPLRTVIREGAGRWLHIFLVSWLISTSISPLSEILALKSGAVDWPDRRKVHQRPTPMLGGIAVITGIFAAIAVNGCADTPLILLLLSAGVLFTLECADDIIGLSHRTRLLTQVLLSIILIQGGLVFDLLPGESVWSALGNSGLTIVWMVGLTNGFRSYDGMDGLASGMAVLVSVFLGSTAFMTGQSETGWACVAILGATSGFLPFNFRGKEPAAQFLGNCGSTLLGFLLAGLAVRCDWTGADHLPGLWIPFLIFGVPVYDMVHTTLARISGGVVRSMGELLCSTAQEHIHHRFEALLRSRRYAVLLILLFTACLGLSAIVMTQSSPYAASLILLQCAATLVLINVLERAGKSRERRSVTENDRRA